MSIYAKADSQNDIDNIGLRFFILGHYTGQNFTSASSYNNLVTNGSDLNYLYDFTTSQKIDLDLIIQKSN